MRRPRGFTDDEAGDRLFMENTTGVEDVAAALASIKAELEELGHTIEVINFDRLTHETGITEATVRKLFAGESVAPGEVDPPFKDRLRFLLDTRLKENGRKHTFQEVADAVGVAKSTITNLLNGSRNPGFDVSKDLAEFFNAPGFFTLGPKTALLTALGPVLEQARLIAELKGRRVERVALRGSVSAGSDQLSRQLQAAIHQVVETAQRASQAPTTAAGGDEDPELRELAATMRSLPANHRRSVMGILRSAVGLAKHDD
ncbi:helix-turn-helix transcriptional regulator [Streptomyces sp. NPDC048191]|uniref:helix-turn-helix domain-containing protein n=1 Tax=Streptomyces sp. NPDC048191 TaxID=3155484 RepID=UPI0033FB2127